MWKWIRSVVSSKLYLQSNKWRYITQLLRALWLVRSEARSLLYSSRRFERVSVSKMCLCLKEWILGCWESREGIVGEVSRVEMKRRRSIKRISKVPNIFFCLPPKQNKSNWPRLKQIDRRRRLTNQKGNHISLSCFLCLSSIWIGIWRCWFLWQVENRRTRRKSLGAGQEPTRNSTHVWHWVGIEPRPQWWEESAPTKHASHKEVINFISTIQFYLFTVLLTWKF